MIFIMQANRDVTPFDDDFKKSLHFLRKINDSATCTSGPQPSSPAQQPKTSVDSPPRLDSRLTSKVEELGGESNELTQSCCGNPPQGPPTESLGITRNRSSRGFLGYAHTNQAAQA